MHKHSLDFFFLSLKSRLYLGVTSKGGMRKDGISRLGIFIHLSLSQRLPTASQGCHDGHLRLEPAHRELPLTTGRVTQSSILCCFPVLLVARQSPSPTAELEVESGPLPTIHQLGLNLYPPPPLPPPFSPRHIVTPVEMGGQAGRRTD